MRRKIGLGGPAEDDVVIGDRTAKQENPSLISDSNTHTAELFVLRRSEHLNVLRHACHTTRLGSRTEEM